jgi:hypothetical protein
VKEDIIKQQIQERYGKIALVGNSSEGCCCAPTECCGDDGSNSHNSLTMLSPLQIAENIGYDVGDLNSIPETSILGVGCGAPVKFANIQEGEVVVDIGSGLWNRPKDITEDMMRNSTKIVNMGCMEKDWCPTAFVPNLVDWGNRRPQR